MCVCVSVSVRVEGNDIIIVLIFYTSNGFILRLSLYIWKVIVCCFAVYNSHYLNDIYDDTKNNYDESIYMMLFWYHLMSNPLSF